MCVSWVKDLWIVYMNIFDILIHDITNIKSKTMVQKRSFYMNVTNLKRVRRRSLTRMRKQNTTLKSHIRLTIVSFNKLCIILDILRGEGKFLCPTCNSFASSYSSLSPRAMWEFRGWWWFL